MEGTQMAVEARPTAVACRQERRHRIAKRTRRNTSAMCEAATLSCARFCDGVTVRTP